MKLLKKSKVTFEPEPATSAPRTGWLNKSALEHIVMRCADGRGRLAVEAVAACTGLSADEVERDFYAAHIGPEGMHWLLAMRTYYAEDYALYRERKQEWDREPERSEPLAPHKVNPLPKYRLTYASIRASHGGTRATAGV